MMALIMVLDPNSKQFASDWMKDDITKKQRFTIFELQCHSTEKSNIVTNNYHLNSCIAIILLALS